METLLWIVSILLALYGLFSIVNYKVLRGVVFIVLAVIGLIWVSLL